MASQASAAETSSGTNLRTVAISGLRGADRLDVVAVGIDQEGGVIGGAIVLAQPRRAVVPAARRQPRRVEGIDSGAAGGAKGDVDRADGPALREIEARIGVG